MLPQPFLIILLEKSFGPSTLTFSVVITTTLSDGFWLKGVRKDGSQHETIHVAATLAFVH